MESDGGHPPVRLYQKLLKVMGALHNVQKRGRNNFHGYNYATEADVETVVRDAMVNVGVLCMPTVLNCTIEQVQTAKGGTERLARLTMQYRWIDGESGEMITSEFISEGQDPGEKGVYKAYAGGVKYALLKTFHIPTGDDPEYDNRRPEQAGQGQARGGLSINRRGAPQQQAQQTQQRRPAPAAGGATQRAQGAQQGTQTPGQRPSGAPGTTDGKQAATSWEVAPGVDASNLRPAEKAAVVKNHGWRSGSVTVDAALTGTGEALTVTMAGRAAAQLGAVRPQAAIWVRRDAQGKVQAYSLGTPTTGRRAS